MNDLKVFDLIHKHLFQELEIEYRHKKWSQSIKRKHEMTEGIAKAIEEQKSLTEYVRTLNGFGVQHFVGMLKQYPEARKNKEVKAILVREDEYHRENEKIRLKNCKEILADKGILICVGNRYQVIRMPSIFRDEKDGVVSISDRGRGFYINSDEPTEELVKFAESLPSGKFFKIDRVDNFGNFEKFIS